MEVGYGRRKSMEPRHSLFREKALQAYTRTQEKDVYPQFVPSLVPVLLSIVLFLLILAGAPVWWGEVPVFTNGPGIVLPEKTPDTSRSHPTVIMLFLPMGYASQVHPGTPVQMSGDSAGQQFTGTIKHVHAGIMSADEARQRYLLNNTAAQAIPQSSLAVTIIPTTKSVPHLHIGDLVTVRVQIGSQRLLSLLLSLR